MWMRTAWIWMRTALRRYAARSWTSLLCGQIFGVYSNTSTDGIHGQVVLHHSLEISLVVIASCSVRDRRLFGYVRIDKNIILVILIVDPNSRPLLPLKLLERLPTQSPFITCVHVNLNLSIQVSLVDGTIEGVRHFTFIVPPSRIEHVCLVITKRFPSTSRKVLKLPMAIHSSRLPLWPLWSLWIRLILISIICRCGAFAAPCWRLTRC